MKTFLIVLAVAVFGTGAYLLINQTNDQGALVENTPSNLDQVAAVGMESNHENPRVVLATNKGDITLELFKDRMPVTAENFLKLAREGFYDHTKFHRVVAGFMIQGGDPLSAKTDTAVYGTGGPGYTIEDEFVAGLSNLRGTIAMANTGAPNSGGSQFFINLVDNVGLDFDKDPIASKHPVFGKVVEGMDVVDTIGKVSVGARHIPEEPIIIEKITIIGDTSPDVGDTATTTAE